MNFVGFFFLCANVKKPIKRMFKKKRKCPSKMTDVKYVHYKCNSAIRQLSSFGKELISHTVSVVGRLPLGYCKREHSMFNISCLDSDPSSKQTCHPLLTKPVSLDAPLCHRHFFLILPWSTFLNTEHRFGCHSNAWAVDWNICPLVLRNRRKK